MKAIELFEKKHPNIKIKPEFSGWDGYWDKLSVRVSGGSAPDVIQMSTAYLNDYANRQALLDLYQYDINLENISEGTISTGELDGKLYAIPAGISAHTLIYDPAMLEKAGVAMPERLNWDKLAEIANQVSDKLGAGVFGVPDESSSPEMLSYYVRTKGMEYFKDGKIGFDKQTLIDYFKFWEALRQSGGTSSAEISASYYQAPLEQFPIVQGKSPFGLLSSNQYGSIATLANRPLEMALLPKDDEGSEPVFLAPSMYWSAYAKSKHPKEAAMFIDFLINDEEAGKMLKADRGVPISSRIRNVLKSQITELDLKQFEFVDQATEIAQPINIIDPKGAGEVRNLQGTIAQEIQFGQKTPEEAAEEFINKANDILEKMK
jgi:multiple sugar transport system substrate-binding protein